MTQSGSRRLVRAGAALCVHAVVVAVLAAVVGLVLAAGLAAGVSADDRAAAQTAAQAATQPVDDSDVANIPSLVGAWRGENRTISDAKGLRSWTKTVNITEQTDRRFRGYFTYSAGTKHFFGVIFPDNETVNWVASDSRGTNQGRLLGPDRLAACYIEPGIDATAGCSDLKRISNAPPPAPEPGAGR